MIGAIAAIAVAWLAGAAVVVRLWPAREVLPLVALAGLAGLVGPLTVGALVLVASLCGVPPALTRALVVAAVIVAGIAVAARARRSVRATGTGVALATLLAIAVAGTTVLALRTHLGWDGTVVWYHKARMIAASGGHMPADALADRTRAWTAPDYPLHVPQAMAWVRLWQPVEDERALKLLPAAWCAALLCLVVAGVVDRAGGTPAARWRAAAAVLVVATTSRLLVGEGALTSGYADGPLAGLIVALTWIAWRSRWGRATQWHGLLAVLALGAVWTKQEGAVIVLATTAACVVGQWRRPWTAVRFALPALLLAVAWGGYAAWIDAPVAMAYAWPGALVALARLPVIIRAYLGEAVDLADWGMLWPVLALLLARGAWATSWRDGAILAAAVFTGASAFLLSGWPDVSAHLAVTVPRQFVQLAPALVVLALSSETSGKSR